MMHNHQSAAEFMHSVFERIKHGDEKHQAWLKEECVKLVGDLEKVLDETQQWSQDRFVDALNGDFTRVSPALKNIIQGHVPALREGQKPSVPANPCPKCKSPIIALWSGVKCSNVKCDWWDCF